MSDSSYRGDLTVAAQSLGLPAPGVLEARMSNGEPFTFQELAHLGLQAGIEWQSVDAAIQRWRKRGWIAFTRQGRNVVWRLTPAGREANL